MELLNPDDLAHKFPWMNTKGVSLASFGKPCLSIDQSYNVVAVLRIQE